MINRIVVVQMCDATEASFLFLSPAHKIFLRCNIFYNLATNSSN